MKLKSLLLLVSSISLLASCGKSSAPAIDNTDSNITSDTNTGSQDTGTQDTGSSDTGSTDTNPGTDTDTGTDTGDTSPVEEDKVYATPEDFISGFSGGTQFDNDNNLTKLHNALDPNKTIISSLEAEKISVQEHALVESGDSVVDLTLGSGSKAGKLTFNTNSPIKAVSFTLQAYTKYVSYTSSNNIDNAEFQVNEFDVVTLTPGTATSSAPVETYAYTFETPTSKVFIKNSAGNQRVFIKSVTFTF